MIFSITCLSIAHCEEPVQLIIADQLIFHAVEVNGINPPVVTKNTVYLPGLRPVKANAHVELVVVVIQVYQTAPANGGKYVL
jgi:hypothetical protein